MVNFIQTALLCAALNTWATDTLSKDLRCITHLNNISYTLKDKIFVHKRLPCGLPSTNTDSRPRHLSPGFCAFFGVIHYFSGCDWVELSAVVFGSPCLWLGDTLKHTNQGEKLSWVSHSVCNYSWHQRSSNAGTQWNFTEETSSSVLMEWVTSTYSIFVFPRDQLLKWECESLSNTSFDIHCLKTDIVVKNWTY